MKDLLVLLQEDAWTKDAWKKYTVTMVTSHHERELREAASTNSRMSLLNISLLGLNGKPHYILENTFTADDVKKLRIHVKMLSQDYLTYGTLALQSAARGVTTTSGHCRICPGEWEDIQHILTECGVTSPARDAILPKIGELMADAEPSLDWTSLLNNNGLLTQFLVDPCSMSLQNCYRLPINNTQLPTLISLTREICFISHNLRTTALRSAKVKCS